MFGLGVHIGFHPGNAVVRHLLGQVAVELLLGDVVPLLGGDCPEGVLDLLAGLDVLRLLADHEGHVLLQGDAPISVGAPQVQDGLELRFRFPVLHHGEVVTQGVETGLECIVVQLFPLGIRTFSINDVINKIFLVNPLKADFARGVRL